MTVYFDMDRVLVDFAAQAEKYKILKRNQRVNWVKVFLYGEKFWSQMNFLYLADYYFRMISMYCAERNISVKILSSVGLKSGKKGKLNWCRKNLNLEKKDIILVKAAKNKYRYAITVFICSVYKRPKLYYGFNAICYLSNGNTRTFIKTKVFK